VPRERPVKRRTELLGRLCACVRAGMAHADRCVAESRRPSVAQPAGHPRAFAFIYGDGRQPLACDLLIRAGSFPSRALRLTQRVGGRPHARWRRVARGTEAHRISRRMSPLLTLGQVCERVQLSPCAVRRAIHRGELRAHKLGGRLRIPQAALDEWVRASVLEPAVVADEPHPQLSIATTNASGTFRERLKSGARG